MQLFRTTMLQMNIILIAILFVTVDCKCKSKGRKQTTINPLQKTKETKNLNGHLGANAITEKPVPSSLLTLCRVIMKTTIPNPTANLATLTDCSRCQIPTPASSDCLIYTQQQTSPHPTPSTTDCICPQPTPCPQPQPCPEPTPYPQPQPCSEPTPSPLDCSICPQPHPCPHVTQPPCGCSIGLTTSSQNVLPIDKLPPEFGPDDTLSNEDDCEFDSSADNFTNNYITTFVICGVVFAMHCL